MRLLIAEDELWLRKRLVSTIDWSSYGISEVYEAEDGGEALEIALKEKPDIVITDIRMPELSGIDLMKKLNENSIFSKMIVVSGYDDFEYAQGALRMGAINYLLKPVDEEELLDSVKRCVEELKKEKNKETVFDKQSAASEMLMEHIYEDLIFETSEKRTEELLQKLSRKEIGFPFQSAAVVNMQVREHTFFVNDKVKSDMWSVYQWLRRNLQEDCYECQYLYMRGSQIVLLLFGDDPEAKFMERVENWVQLILEALQKELNISLFMAAGDVTDDFSGIHRSYEMAQKKIKEKRAEEKRILALRNQETAQELNTRFDDVYGEYDFKLLIKEIRNGDSEKAQTELQAILQSSSRRLQSADMMKLQLFYMNFINRIAGACLPECEAYADELAMQCMTVMRELIYIGSDTIVTEMWDCLRKFVEKLVEVYQENNGKRKHWMIDQVLQYVEENYNTALSTRDIAGRFFMNTSYFSKLFHEQMGCTFSNYLINVRVEKAKMMLTQTNMKLYDIAEAVGYTNVQYFSTIFKEKEGLTPSAFRQMRSAVKDEYTGK
nr:response regulator [uncultured Blautia sp.]